MDRRDLKNVISQYIADYDKLKKNDEIIVEIMQMVTPDLDWTDEALYFGDYNSIKIKRLAKRINIYNEGDSLYDVIKVIEEHWNVMWCAKPIYNIFEYVIMLIESNNN